MKALLDGDIYAYRSAAASENDDVNIAIWRMEDMIDNTLAETKSDEFSIFLSGATNFRTTVYPEYKANRPPERPRHLKALKEYLVEKYSAETSVDCEADDLLGIAQCSQQNTVICSLDKDLRMIPGNHYSWAISGKITRGPNAGKTWTRDAEHIKVEEFEGLVRFYTQILTGDRTDNVMGASGIGVAKAGRLLEGLRTEQELYEAVQSCFSTEEELLMTGQCLWIFRKPNDRWQIPKSI